jgi:hypothetical protein
VRLLPTAAPRRLWQHVHPRRGSSRGRGDGDLHPGRVTEADIAKGIGQFYEHYAIPADSFARAVAFAISQPEDVDINEIPFRPTRQEL